MGKGTSSYRIKEDNGLYFLTFSTVNWIDIFTRSVYSDIMVKSLNYCQQNKGLQLFAWCIMSNHIHLVARAEEGFKLSDILRDLKKHTSKLIIKTIQQSNESRKEWLLPIMLQHGAQNSKTQKYQLWRNDNHPIILYNNAVIQQKINYIHQNPVKANIVLLPEHYIYSSAQTYANQNTLIPLHHIIQLVD